MKGLNVFKSLLIHEKNEIYHAGLQIMRLRKLYQLIKNRLSIYEINLEEMIKYDPEWVVN